MGWAVFQMLLALGMVLGILLLLLRLLKRTPWIQKDLPADFSIRILTTRPIAPRKYISLVEIGGEVLALGVSEAQISYLTKVEHPELLQKFRPAEPAGPAKPPTSWLDNLPLKKAGLLRHMKRIQHGPTR